MTTLTASARPESLAPVPWRRMAWVTWRQHRIALTGVAVLLGGLAALLWVVGLPVHRAYAAAIACHPASSAACTVLISRFNGMGGLLANGYLLQAVPALIGAFAGAPVLARELETGTFRYAWTQGFGRWRWTLAKLVALAVVTAAAAGAFSVLISWYYRPYLAAGNHALSLTEWSPLSVGLFDLRGVAFAAWTLAAFAIGALVGMLLRRVVPAIAATLVAYAGLAVAAGGFLRQHYLAPLAVKNMFGYQLPGSAWVVSEQWQKTSGGQPVSQSRVSQVLQGAPEQVAGKGGIPQAASVLQYLTQHGYTLLTSYQPGSRFWSFQWIEGGWLLALAVLLIAATVWLVRRRAV
jgi:ABC-type transport system involved in multi-copper enzyme maturation permease subunit